MPDPALDLDHARWARARDDYRAGATAAEVCARYELSRSTFYARASAERWRRADLPSAKGAAGEIDDFDPAAPRLPSPALAELAHRRITHAIQAGRVREALMWARLAKEMRTLAADEENKSWRRLHREAAEAAEALKAATAAAPGSGSGEPAGGRPTSEEAQPSAEAEQSQAGLDCPDCFFASDPSEGEPAPLPDEDEALAVAMEANWDAAAWAEWALLRAELVQERPDLPWWTVPEREDDEGADGGEEPL